MYPQKLFNKLKILENRRPKNCKTLLVKNLSLKFNKIGEIDSPTFRNLLHPSIIFLSLTFLTFFLFSNSFSDDFHKLFFNFITLKPSLCSFLLKNSQNLFQRCSLTTFRKTLECLIFYACLFDH